MASKREISTKRLIERLEQDSRKEDAMELARRATKGDSTAGEFILSSIDRPRKSNAPAKP